MAVGLLFGAFWAGLGILMWWWPAAIFVAFSSDDVTPGARAFAVGAIFVGIAFLTLETSRVGIGDSFPATAVVVGVLLLIKPVNVLGADEEGTVTPRRLGAALTVGGTVLLVTSVV
ncbi:hypothetical protein [Halolamina salina]|uniref:Uncharacterized protein n=1 Tax=Halolamina salina TaxID=1220023 RepID=A0ABD6B6V2_9EURY